jgi:hypothetical protein
MLLPLPIEQVKDVSLSAHLALAACRTGNGNKHQLVELIRATYLSYLLWKEGYGEIAYTAFCAAESKLEEAAARAERTGEWTLDEHDALLLEDIIRVYDEQMGSVSTQSYMRCTSRLNRLLHCVILNKVLGEEAQDG